MSATNTYQPVDLSKAIVQKLEEQAWENKGVCVSILRLDLIHPVLSGNKWFKLKYHLQAAKATGKKGILTFGGAWSNHLVATAIACDLEGLSSIGIVRGEAPAALSATLQEAQQYGMQLEFVSREMYSAEEVLIEAMQTRFPDYAIVPQGGQHTLGVKGAMEILALANSAPYSHIACAAGTGTMLAGIVKALLPGQQALGFSSLKLADQLNNSLVSMIRAHAGMDQCRLIYDFHFGGYARKTDTLLQFMDQLYLRHQLPTDIIYTGKLLYGINSLIHDDYFPHGSRLLVIHSGGLQGNRSLPPGKLCF